MKWSAGVAPGTSVSAAVGCSDLEDGGHAVMSYSTDPPTGCSHVCVLLLSASLRDENECQNIVELLLKLMLLFMPLTARRVLACLDLTHFMAVSVWLKAGCQQHSDQGRQWLAVMNDLRYSFLWKRNTSTNVPYYSFRAPLTCVWQTESHCKIRRKKNNRAQCILYNRMMFRLLPVEKIFFEIVIAIKLVTYAPIPGDTTRS